MTCFTWLFVLAGAVFLMATLMRWFEQTAEAVDEGWWNKVAVLVVVPFAVWFYPSRVGAGRPVPVPLHVPVAGMGAAPKVRSTPAAEPAEAAPVAGSAREPPPGTPEHFKGMPVIPPAAKRPKSAIEPEKFEKLRQKMREQGMLPPEDDAG